MMRDRIKSDKINYSHYDPNEEQSALIEERGKRGNWGLVRDAMGLKDINSEKDLEAMRRLVNQEYTARTVESQTGDLDKRISALEAGQGQEKEEDNKAIINAAPSPKAEEAKEKTSMWKSQFNPQEMAATDHSEQVALYKEKFSGDQKTDPETKRGQAKERASAFALTGLPALNGPGQTSTNIDYNSITGENVAESTRQLGQDMSRSFESNWLQFAKPSGYKGTDPEGF
jgi:hypothetical protein